MDLSDRVKALKNQLLESDKELKIIESAWLQSLDNFEAARKAIEKTVTLESVKVISAQYKETMAKQIELFRTHAEIIGKISPTARDHLWEKINELEKNDREFQIKNIQPDITQEQIDPLIKKFNKLYEEIESSIKIFRMIIQDTIKKFEK